MDTVARYLLIGVFFIGAAQPALGEEKKVDLAIKFLTDDNLSKLNFEWEPFVQYCKTFSDTAQALAVGPRKQDILVLKTFHKEREPTIAIYARPALSSGRRSKMLAELKAIKSIRAKLIDFSLLYMFKIRGGATDKEAAFSPAFETPDMVRERTLRRADLKTKLLLIRRWANNDVIPVLSALQRGADAKFTGVRAVGEILARDFSKTQDIHKLTSENSSYWRATLEMSQGNQIIPVSRIFMYVARGKLDHARSYWTVIQAFSKKGTVASGLLSELKWRLNIFNKHLDQEIRKGITLHDKEEYANAISLYEGLLEQVPCSAWAHYERYFSKSFLQLSNGKKSRKKSERIFRDWEAVKKKIFDCNPLFTMDIKARTGREGYRLFRRHQIKSLFKKKSAFKKDLIAYADIALDLGVYDFAAHLYWLIVSSFPEESYAPRNMIGHFLYCLHNLGDKIVRLNFEGDHSKSFKRIAAERSKLMKKSKIYKSFHLK